MKRPEPALAALVLLSLMVAPVVAQPVALAPQPAMSESCSACFAYLEFPPLPPDHAPANLASAHRDRLPPAIAAPNSPLGAAELHAVASINP